MHAFPIVDIFTIIITFSFSSIIHICEVSVDESGISPAPELFWNVVNNEYELHDPFGQLEEIIHCSGLFQAKETRRKFT